LYQTGRIAVPETPGITEQHINRFQVRANFHFAVSYLILAGIVGLFGFAIYIFLFAQEIDRSKGSVEVFQELSIGRNVLAQAVPAAKKEAEVFLEQFKAGTVALTTVLISIKAYAEENTKLHLFEEQIRLMNQSGYIADIDAPRSKEELIIIANGNKELKDTADRLLKITEQQFKTGYAVSQADVLSAQRLVNDANLAQQLYQQRASAALPAAEQKRLTTNLDTIELVRTSLVRFGGVTVMLFLISLLTPIYRYNVRLGTFYQARADTLLLSRDTHVQNFLEITRLFTPAYGFEREPTTPVESIASFAKEAGGIMRKV
jgi:hypothetical protein